MPEISEIVACGNKALPRSLDVQISVTKAQTELTTDLSVLLFVTDSGPLSHGAGRVRYYDTHSAISNDFGSSSEAWKAGREFFSQSPRSKTLAIAQAFSTPQAGFLKTGAVDIAATIAVTDGSFTINIDGASSNVTGIDFTTDTTMADIAASVQARAEIVIPGTTVIADGTQLIITSPTTGDNSTVSVMNATDPVTGTDVSGSGFLNGATGISVLGYAPTTFINELDLIEEAARCSGRFAYGLALDAVYRDTQESQDAAAWTETRRMIFAPTSNDPFAWDGDSTIDIGYVLQQAGYARTIKPFYHDNAEYYPDISMLARMLSVDYGGVDTAITAKFKNLPGVPVVGLSTTQWSTLNSKGYNSFTLTGNNSRFVREGGQVAESWWIDDLINLDNFTEELEVSILNAYLRNGKIPLTPIGQAIQRDSIVPICEQYVTNGVFADRQVVDTAEKSGKRTIPDYDIIQAELASLTDADRTSRIGPPVSIDVQLAGANHSISINVTASD